MSGQFCLSLPKSGTLVQIYFCLLHVKQKYNILHTFNVKFTLNTGIIEPQSIADDRVSGYSMLRLFRK